jgi:hypothetical protein
VTSISTVLRGNINGFGDVIKTKCMPILFYGIDCLYVDLNAKNKL